MQENEIQVRVQQEIQKFLSDPDNIIQAYQKSLEARDLVIRDMRPKAEMWETAMGSERLEEMAAVAKILNFKDVGRNRLFEYLRDRNVLRSNNEPYQKYVDSCFFKVIEQTKKVDDWTFLNNKTMVTQRGLEYIKKLLTEDGYEPNAR